MKIKVLSSLILIIIMLTFISANECTDNNGICTPSCTEPYKSQNFNCDGYVISSFCCIPEGDFSCQETEGYFCSPFNVGEKGGFFGIPNKDPSEYGLEKSTLNCPLNKFCYKKIFSQYKGEGIYELSPGDEVLLKEGLILKYVSFTKEATWSQGQKEVKGNIANIQLYNSTPTYGAKDRFISGEPTGIFSLDNLNPEKTKSFSYGVWFLGEPLAQESEIAKINISIGSLSTCIDTDAYTIGISSIELSTGKWGRNYYKKGLTTENKEDINGKSKTNKEDICSNNLLIEYYCDNGALKSEEKKCKCLDDSTCKKGFFDSISEWIKKRFGNLN
jgi:hypothetical protein